MEEWKNAESISLIERLRADLDRVAAERDTALAQVEALRRRRIEDNVETREGGSFYDLD